MSEPIHVLLVFIAALLLVSIFASKLAVRFGVPALILFIVIGMLIGSEGFGGIEFDDPQLTQSVGVVALVFILFSGGLDTPWKNVRSSIKEGILLSTIGVGITALSVGWLATTYLGFSWETGILLGATIASTDAAAVFSILRGQSIGLKGKLKPILELESGSNDPMAVFLTLGMIELITKPETPVTQLAVLFVIQMSVGAVIGIAIGYLMLTAINRLNLEYDGLYPVLTIGFVLFCYGLTTILGGNGFLAIYLCGIVLGRHDFIHKNSLSQFHDGLTWLMQIIMFIVLGLQVFPSHLQEVMGTGLLVAVFMLLVARPLSVFVALLPIQATFQEKIFISWVGLRGAAPIILATFSQIAAISTPTPIFELVFFVVLVSVMIQGTTIITVARWLGLYEPETPDGSFVSRIMRGGHFNDYLLELYVNPLSEQVNKRIVELSLPEGTLIVLINRRQKIIIPQGKSMLEGGDQLLLLAPKSNQEQVKRLFGEASSL